MRFFGLTRKSFPHKEIKVSFFLHFVRERNMRLPISTVVWKSFRGKTKKLKAISSVSEIGYFVR